MAIKMSGDIHWRCVVKNRDFDNEVAVWFINEAEGSPTRVKSKEGVYEEVPDLVMPEPTIAMTAHEGRDLAKEMALWAERSGRPVAPAHTDALKAELKLVTNERDFLRDLLRDHLGQHKAFSIDDVHRAVQDYHRATAGQKDPSPVVRYGGGFPIGPKGVSLNSKRRPNRQDEEKP